MRTEEFIKKLQKKYGKDLRTNLDRARKEGKETAGLYWKGEHIGSLPVKEIFDNKKDSYQTSYGVKHRTTKMVGEIVRKKIKGK